MENANYISNYVNKIKLRSKQRPKQIALLLASAALLARMGTAVVPEVPQVPVPATTVIEYQLDQEELLPAEEEEQFVEEAPEAIGFWGLHRRFWDKLAAPVKAGVWQLLWRALAAVIALALAALFVLVWPLPQIIARSKNKFKDFMANPDFKRFSFLAKLIGACGLLTAYFLIPSSRRPWLLGIGLLCLTLLALSYYWIYHHKAQAVETQNPSLLKA